ncbi:glycoside hydrolase family 3 N-terminal domain-containing protein [Aquimarina agarivorans]|uniref:glycoside hydrolase family 3 N-terminal domain-containing protein n=1 Tax=Aquimarina agarivorans TaxID=980584 RepID=UPI000248EAF9|nr:glycoside hydrolase family 3 N-terminal domain-containing protein [Aquimarina agarivorans]
MKYLLPLITLFCSALSISAQNDPLAAYDEARQTKWVDSIYNSLTLKQKVGQLFVVDVFSEKGKPEQDRIAKLIENQEIGGLIFSKGTPYKQAKMHNALQAKSKIPLLITMDAEWGLAMRLDSTYAFPWNMTLGALKSDELVKRVGAQVGKHCKRLGVHMNFGPVLDINTNPLNPIIGNRSFGESKERVTQKSLAFMEGMHSVGVLSSGKHFPGHGDTDTDSHKTLPSILFSEKRINDVELYPYRKLIKKGLSSVMVAHLNIPSIESTERLPSSISQKVVTDILIDKLKFEGLIFTDALNMKGASNFKEPGAIDLAAFKAGNDILLISEDIPKAAKKIITEYTNGGITEARLALSVKKVLKAKYKVGLHKYAPVALENLHEDLHTIENDLLYEQVAENSITLLRNDSDAVPIRNLEMTKIAYVPMGSVSGKAFYDQLKLYAKVDLIEVKTTADLFKLDDYNQVIVGFHKSNASPWKPFEFKAEQAKVLNLIAAMHKTTLVSFAKPYALQNLSAIPALSGIVVAYQNSTIFQQKAAQALFGAIPFKGKLPVSIAPHFKEGDGFFLNNSERLAYGLPESVGVNSHKLAKIDSLVNYALREEMTPGLQLLVARKGKVIYNKSYGYQTYKKEVPITNQTIYDLASLTKILGTLPVIMKMEQTGVMSITDKFVDLLPELKGTNKEHIKIVEALSHYARLQAWIPFYISTLDSVSMKPSPKYYRKLKDSIYSTQVTDELFIRKDMKDSIFKEIVDSELRERKGYKYSDLPYYFLQRYIEKYFSSSMAELTHNLLYNSLGANRTGYLPLRRFKKEEIVPTEIDELYRNTTIQGYVHDQGAAMLGGVGGHAGLFANANDVAKIMQMFLNRGSYGGQDYFKPKTIDKFNTCYYCDEKNRRGVGFDKPQLDVSGPTCGCVSMSSFGHSGFTGTYTWADPDEEIVYVFLSNRTFPDSGNRKLIRKDIRTKIQQLIYEAIDNGGVQQSAID